MQTSDLSFASSLLSFSGKNVQLQHVWSNLAVKTGHKTDAL